MNSRYRANIAYTDNDDGSAKLIEITRPFYALDVQWAGSIKLDEEEREDSLHFRGKKLLILITS